jgi:hypothetical protein
MQYMLRNPLGGGNFFMTQEKRLASFAYIYRLCCTHQSCAGIFKQSMGVRNRIGIELSYTRTPGYTAWRNWFLGIDSWAPSKFKNSGSALQLWQPADSICNISPGVKKPPPLLHQGLQKTTWQWIITAACIPPCFISGGLTNAVTRH